MRKQSVASGRRCALFFLHCLMIIGLLCAGSVQPVKAAYSNPGSTSGTIDDTVNGSVSLLHSSGLNLTLAGGVRDLKDSGRDDPSFFYSKPGYLATLSKLGKSAFSIDYGSNDDVQYDGDEAQSFGAQFVQYIDKWATEFYLSFRNYDLDRSNTDFEGVNALLTGLRVKF